jgi:heparan-sulfate lyase
MNKLFIILVLFVLLFNFNCLGEQSSHKHPEPKFSEQKAENVLELLDLSKPELAVVEQAYNKKELLPACEKLLQYYRSRYQIKHLFLDRKNKCFDGELTNTDKKWADDAMKHVFVGQTKYPSYFRGWDIDWKTNPVKDIEWIIQLHRMYFWESMGKMYWQTKDEKYAQEWVYQFLDWADKNPPDANNTNAWRHLEVGERLTRLVDMFEYFINSPAFTPAVLTVYLENIYNHNEYLISRYPEKSNKTVTEAKGALLSAIYFSEFKNASKWRQKAISMLNNEIKNQVFPDGMQCELSLSYHRGTASGFLDSYQMAVKNGYGGEFSDYYPQIIQKMMEASYKTLLPDFTTPQFGDGWKDTAQKTMSFFEKWNKVFNREDFLYFATKGEKGKAPEQKNFALTDSGFYSMRSGWSGQDTCMILKCGPKVWSHAQPDNGSFELYALGRHFMPDSGCYIYSGDPQW